MIGPQREPLVAADGKPYSGCYVNAIIEVWPQDNQFGKHTDLDFGNPDFMKLADAFGWNGIYEDKSSDLKDALERSFQAEGPSLVVIPIDYRENNLLTKRLGNIACPI